MLKIKKLLLFTLLLFITVITNAQVTTSSMSGVVKNDAGEGLAGATITALHQPTGTRYTSVTRTGGRFDILNMNPGGPYIVTVTFVGFQEGKRTDVYLSLGDEYRLDFNMSNTATEISEVVVSGQRNRALKSGASTNINNRQINTLPTISRSINDFTRLTPQAGPGNTFNGRDGRFNNIQIDGANFNNNFGLSSSNLPGGDAQPISLDAIEEISVNISPFDVKQGNFTGAGVNAVTRSGTNTFTGSAYGFYRNQNFNGKYAASTKLPAATQSETKSYGMRLGGPIVKNKLFFFVNGEREVRTYPGLNWLATRPGLSGPTVSRTTAADLDAVSSFLKTNYDYETGPYENLGQFASENFKVLGRVDWNINDNNRLTVRYNFVKSVNDNETNGSSAPNPRAASNRWSRNAMAYEGANYGFEDIVSSWTVDFKSKIGKNANNQLIATYTNIETNRTSKSTPFPFVDIQDGAGDQYISFGYELFSWKNSVKNKVITLTDNFSYAIGKHNFTAGASFDYLYFGNSFLRYGTGYYRFNSVADFLNGAAPNAFALTYGYNGTDPIADLEFGQLAAYIQDEIKLTDRFKLLAGVRFDQAIYLEKPIDNPTIRTKTFRDLGGNPITFDVGNWPKSKMMWSPRVGFNWDIFGTRDLVIRGGSGIFTGRLPFVWYTNQPTNSYALQATVERTGSAAATYLFNPDPNAYRNTFPQSTATLPSGASLAVVDKDFVFPQVWRNSLAFDKKLPWNMTLTMEAIFSKDINAIRQYNANMALPNSFFTGPDARPRYSSTASRSIDGSVREAMVLSNTSKGGSFSYSAILSKGFSKGFYGQISYSLNYAMDVSGNPGSQAASAWSNLASYRGNNNLLDASVSQYSIPHRFTAVVSKRFEYLRKSLATTISLFYEGSSTGRFSYIYSNDMNNDGVTNDLMYVPKDRQEAGVFFPSTTAGIADADLFWAYVEQDKYLRKRKGNYTEQNGGLFPWVHTIDMRLLQDFSLKLGSKKHSLQFSMDVLNFTNMLNRNWGNRYRQVYSNARLLRWVSNTSGGIPQYAMNTVSGQKPVKTFETSPTVSSTWGMQLGLRYFF